MKLSDTQSGALDAAARWFKKREKPVFRIFGYAGTGKTSIARYFADSINGDVQYGAFTGKAAMVMRKNGCANASTLHSLIYKPEQDEETGYVKFKKRPAFEMQNIKLFIVDECSMVDENLGRDLLGYNVPVLVLGDPGQLPPVSGGGYFTNADPDVMLEEVHRQAADNPILRLATDVREGRGISVGDYGLAKVITKDDLSADLVTGVDQVLVGANKTRSRYNARLRDLKGFQSKLPEPGDRLVALKNDHPNGILNGGLWNVVEIKKRRKATVDDGCISMIVKSLDFDSAAIDVRSRKECFTGALSQVPWRELRGTQQFDYGYALTVHKGQGSQWPSVCLFDERGAFGADGPRWLYTGITRASEQLTIVT